MVTSFDRMNLNLSESGIQTVVVVGSALLVRVAVLCVAPHAVKGLLGALLSLSHDLVLLALLAGLDVGGSFVLGIE